MVCYRSLYFIQVHSEWDNRQGSPGCRGGNLTSAKRRFLVRDQRFGDEAAILEHLRFIVQVSEDAIDDLPREAWFLSTSRASA